MEMRKRTELVFAGLMKWIMQIGQTHCVYVIASEHYDAFLPARNDPDGRPLHDPADQPPARSVH